MVYFRKYFWQARTAGRERSHNMKRTRDEAQGNDAFPGQEAMARTTARRSAFADTRERRPVAFVRIRPHTVGDGDLWGFQACVAAAFCSDLEVSINSQCKPRLGSIPVVAPTSKEIFACASTGRGKTLAYATPRPGFDARTNKQCIRALVVVRAGDLGCRWLKSSRPCRGL